MCQRFLAFLRLVVFVIAGCVLARPAFGADRVMIKGHLADPARVVARLKNADAKGLVAAPDLAGLGEAVQARFTLVPGLVVLEAVPPAPGLAAEPRRDAKQQALQLQQRLERLQKTGLFEYVEPDWIITANATPTDAAFTDGRLWGLRNLGQNGGTAGVDIAAPAAWDLSTGSSEVIVAVIDSGIRYTHQDLRANMWRNPGEIAGNGLDDDGDGYVDNVHGINAINGSGDPMDDNGHGTHVSGTIGGAANDGNPQVGVAWSVRLMGCKFLGADGSGKTTDAIKCIDFAVAKGARLMNASYGGGGYSQAVYDALARARARGVVMIAAAGNDGANNDTSPSYPANYNLDNVISVAAINRLNQLATFSNYGRTTVDLAAPGVEIYSCWMGSDSDYKTISGTSMATPHVVGVAALLLASQPGLSVAELRQQLLGTVTPVAALQNNTVTGGRVNAYNALATLAGTGMRAVFEPPAGASLVGGSDVQFSVRLVNPQPVTNATVSGTIFGNVSLAFTNTGTAGVYATGFITPPFSNSIQVVVHVVVPGQPATNFLAAYPVVIPPPNNDFAKRSVLAAATNLIATGNSQQATKEPGEPSHAGNAGGRSIWWSWVAPATGTYLVKTTGSSFDTVLAVYTGTTMAQLVNVAANDDDPTPGSAGASAVRFDAAGGVAYQIAVDGYGGVGGDVQLQVLLVPPGTGPANDAFTQRTVITGSSAVVSGSNLQATKETNEPSHAGNPGGGSVWWTWTAPASGNVTLHTTGSTFDTLLAVYSGTAVSALTAVANNDDDPNGGTTSRLEFQAGVGSAYQIAVDGYGGAQGNVTLSLSLAAGSARPPNDNFAAATPLSGTNLAVSGTSVGATKEANEPEHAGNAGGQSVWWRWVSPAKGAMVVSTRNSNFDTLLAVYTGTNLASLAEVAANDDDPAGGVQSTVTFNVDAGQAFYFCVDGFRDYAGAVAEGTVQLSLTYYGGRPANDDFAAQPALSGAPLTVRGSNLGATQQTGEPKHNGYDANRSVWWAWRAPRAGFVRITTAGSSFDTLLAVYSGATLPSLTSIQANDDALSGADAQARFSEVVFYAFSNEVFQIAVDGFGAASGEIQLNISQNLTNRDLYYTGFSSNEGFVPGQSLNGKDGWIVHGDASASKIISASPSPGLQAYIGLAPDYSATNHTHYAWVPVNHQPASNQLVRFSVKMKITDSSNNYYDQFAWGVFNRAGKLLFEVRFHNEDYPPSVWFQLNDGLGESDTGVTIGNDVTYDFSILMDFEHNVWEASLDGLTVVERQPINSDPAEVADFGDVDAIWYWFEPPMSGDNYMAFDDYRVEVIDSLLPPSITAQPYGVASLAGESPTLTVQAAGTAPLRYQWWHEAGQIANATNAVLVLANIAPGQAGNYWATVANAFGAVTSEVAVVLVSLPQPPPANDGFSQRTLLSGASNLVLVATAGATREAGEPLHAGNPGGASLWWSWRAPRAGKFTVSTVGSDFDTLLAVYSGTALNALSLVATNDDAQAQQRASWLTFAAQSNALYQIAVDGYGGATGNLRLAVKPDASPVFGTPQLNGALVLEFSGEQGLMFKVQASTDLKTWTTVTNLANPQGVVRFQDTPNGSRRFYRVLQE